MAPSAAELTCPARAVSFCAWARIADGAWHRMTANAVAAPSMVVDLIIRSLRCGSIALFLVGRQTPPNRGTAARPLCRHPAPVRPHRQDRFRSVGSVLQHLNRRARP